jgi:sulfopyruvate decarboxylase TPP-binding subunit
MLDGPEVVAAFRECGLTHVIWLPDSSLGKWEEALVQAAPEVQLIRVCREGEAIAIAAGLMLGGKRPIVVMQCTGLFEAGDALRNVVHDLKLPLIVLVGVRSMLAYRNGLSSDTCPLYTEAIVSAWQIPSRWIEPTITKGDLASLLSSAQNAQSPQILLLAE